MTPDTDPWDRFTIHTYRHAAGPDAYRVVFKLTDPAARAAAGSPAVVVLRAGGELVVRYDPPQRGVPGLGRDDYLRKAAVVVKARAGG